MKTAKDDTVRFSLLAHRKLLGKGESSVQVLAKIACDQVGEETNLPVNLVVVLDHSGSMTGDKIRCAVLTIRALLEELGPKDRIGIVAFDSNVTVLAPPVHADEYTLTLHNPRST